MLYPLSYGGRNSSEQLLVSGIVHGWRKLAAWFGAEPMLPRAFRKNLRIAPAIVDFARRRSTHEVGALPVRAERGHPFHSRRNDDAAGTIDWRAVAGVHIREQCR